MYDRLVDRLVTHDDFDSADPSSMHIAVCTYELR